MFVSKNAQMILAQVKKGQFQLMLHAHERSVERGIYLDDVIRCAETCFHWEWQEKHQTHLFLGFLAKDKPGGFTAVFLDEVIVVTVFKRRINRWKLKSIKPIKY